MGAGDSVSLDVLADHDVNLQLAMRIRSSIDPLAASRLPANERGSGGVDVPDSGRSRQADPVIRTSDALDKYARQRVLSLT
jgi:hypothetical protein